ncbi:TRAP transporter large permease [uncultured Marivita sp.]|uniref:TRAP transporter large permease n=1 Tax=uncultured Marivita sp. TaxID=888080 RepID=UPI0026041049|nr:TRAP transporter large permease [uncultured Marivita sp.]
MIIAMFVILAVLLIIGAPIAVALGLSALSYVAMTGRVPEFVVVQRMVGGVDSFPLLAVPFFILAGNLMNSAGITARIFDFALSLIGWLRGGLGHVNVVASVIFSGMSGAAAADAGGLGAIELKAMRDRGYDDDFAIGITAASSAIGPIIPPSLPLVIYGVQTGTSIGALFLAGIVPGLLIALTLMAMIAIVARRRGYPADTRLSLGRIRYTGARAFLSLVTPGIIIGGIMTGAFTATEASVAAVIYALILGTLIYQTMGLRRITAIFLDTLETTAAVLLVVAAASAFAWVLTINRVPDHLAGAILTVSDNPILVILLINLVLLLVGLFLEPVAAITILVPVMMPIAADIGLDPVQLGIMMVLNLMIGLMTPPVGVILFVLARVGNRSVEFVTKATLPFLVPLFLSLLLVSLVPALSLFLPSLLR